MTKSERGGGDGGEVLNINPRTKVGELLDACPRLEEVLIAQAPVFEKLRNPVLRRTAARKTWQSRQRLPLQTVLQPAQSCRNGSSRSESPQWLRMNA